MKKSFITTVLIIITAQICHAQLPAATCGIVITYDNAGNRIKREYVCNPAPVAATQAAHTEFAAIDALRPNPTTGRFTVSFTRALTNASVIITDAKGAVVQQQTINGIQANFDIGKFANGVYFVAINNNGNSVNFKVVKE